MPEFLKSTEFSNALKLGGALIVSGLSAKYLCQTVSNERERWKLASLRKRRQEERALQFRTLEAKYSSVDSDPALVSRYKHITSLSALELAEKLQSKEITAEEAVLACTWKSLKITDEFNCVTEFLEDSLEKARELDNLPTPKGPLHGIPFCVKIDQAYKGLDSNVGCSNLLYVNDEETAVIVWTLEDLGAIPFCRTNCPQTCCSIGSHNPVYGKTLNPLNGLSPGGSSSGTGSLVGGGGCPFGTGADTGGSLRVPAHFCGLATIRSTSNRISSRGCKKCCGNLVTVPGVLTRSAADQIFIYRHMLKDNLQNEMDQAVVPLPWNEQRFETKEPLRIAYIPNFSPALIPPIGDTPEALDKAINTLKLKGHTLIQLNWTLEDTTFLTAFSDQSVQWEMKNILKNDEISPSLKPFTDSLFKKKYSQDTPNPFSKRDAEMHKFFDAIHEQGVDICLCPAFPFPALSIEEVPFFGDSIGYTFVWNWYDVPVGVVKVLEESGKSWETSVSNLDRPASLKRVLIRDGPKLVGMPIGVQVVGKPYHEESVLRIMEELEMSLKAL